MLEGEDGGKKETRGVGVFVYTSDLPSARCAYDVHYIP